MPELPEVETIRCELISLVEGREICSIEIADERFAIPATDIEGKKICTCLRRGKYLFFLLSGGTTLLIHLGMTGKLLFTNERTQFPYLRVVVILDDGFLHFTDMRTFGKIALLDRGEMVECWKKLGVDPLSKGFKENTFIRLLGKSKTRIKDFLLDQRKVSGLGNIYVCEALFRAGIHPQRRTYSLTEKEMTSLYREVVLVLQEALQGGGTTIRDYRRSDAKRGSFQGKLCVYGREGYPCPACGQAIERCVFSSRSSYFCPVCQV